MLNNFSLNMGKKMKDTEMVTKIQITDIKVASTPNDKSPKPNSSISGGNGGVVHKNNQNSDCLVKKKRNKKPKREEGAPKPPKNGYVRYMVCRRVGIRNLFPEKTAIEITKIIAEEWNKLSNEMKKPYLQAAEADKERYIRQLDEYNTMKRSEKSSSPGSDIQKILLGDTESENLPLNSNGDVANNTNGVVKRNLPQMTGVSKKQKGHHIHGHHDHHHNQQSHHQSSRTGEVGIQIFTEEFLEHNKTADGELRLLKKSNIDYEQQNAVLEKHVETMKGALSKMEAENNAIMEKNRLLLLYFNKLKQKTAIALSALPLPGHSSGPTNDNIEDYMLELYNLSTSNSHGPVLNKAKDIIRKLDLHIEL